MAKKTIWYCHHYAGSPSLGMSYRPYYLSKEFKQLGHDAYIIHANHHHLLNQPIEQDNAITLNRFDGVPFITLQTPAYNGNGVGRIKNMLHYASYFKRRSADLIDITGKPDIIIVSSAHPFHFPPLKKLSKKLGCQLVFEVRDLWPLSLIELLNTPKWHPLVLWLAYIERQAYKHADQVVSVLNNAYPYMQTKGLSENRFNFIPNGCCVDDFQKGAPLSPAIDETISTLKEQNKFLVGYAGAMGKPNALEFLLGAMKSLLATHPHIQCVMVGDGYLKKDLIETVAANQLTNVTIFDKITKLQIPTFLSKMDALYLGWSDANIYQYGVSPNKLFDYLNSGKPIVESGGSPKSIVAENGFGIQCQPENTNQISKAIENITNLSEQQIKEINCRSSHLIKEFDYRQLAKKYLDVFAK